MRYISIQNVQLCIIELLSKYLSGETDSLLEQMTE